MFQAKPDGNGKFYVASPNSGAVYVGLSAKAAMQVVSILNSELISNRVNYSRHPW